MKPPYKQIVIGLCLVVVVLVLVEIAALLYIKRSVGVYKQYWSKNNAQTVGANEILYIALGDSTAQGVGATSPAKGYVGLVARALAQKHNQPVKVRNLSVSGAGSADVLRDQLPQLKQTALTQKTIITLAIGANDMSSFDAETFTDTMDALLQAMPKQTIVADIAYFGGGRFRHLEGNVLTANLIINKLAGKYGLTVAPLHRVTQQQHTLLANAADIFHPSNIGYKNWRDAFRQALNL